MTMPEFKVLVPDRKAWVDLRNKAKVEKGVAKPSIGDDVEKVHKTWGWKTMSAHEKEVKKLLADLRVYIDTLKKKKDDKYDKFATTVETKVKKKAEQQLEFVETVLSQKAAYYGLYKAVLDEQKKARNGSVKPLVTACEKLLGAVGPFSMVDPPMWDKKRQALMKIKSEIERAGQMTDPMSNQLDKVMASLKTG
jgi:hypothetical protein